MKILSVTAQKPHSTGSGVFLTELVKAFDAFEIEQSVVFGVYPDDAVNFPEAVGQYPVYFDTAEMPFPIVGMSDEMPYHSLRYRDLNESQINIFEANFMQQIEKAVAELKPDVILCHHLYLLTAMIRARFPGRRIFGVCHGTDLRQMQKHSLKRQFITQQISHLNGIFTLHREQHREIIKVYHAAEDRVWITGSGYNDKVFYNLERRPERPPLRLVFAGKISEKKGVISLIRSLSLLPYEQDELVLSLAGNSGAREEYELITELAGRCRYQVDFLGMLSQKQLMKAFNDSHVFVLPSYYDALPLVVTEALACGLKVVVTDLPGVQEWLDESVKDNGVTYVPMPLIENTDEPVASSLPRFEENLAAAIEAAAANADIQQPDMSGVSWQGVGKKMLGYIEKCYK